MFVFGGNNSGIRDDYKINNSLRFRSSAFAYLSRTPASAGNRTTWTWSAWVKRGTLGTEQWLFHGGNTNYNDANIRINTGNDLTFDNYNGSANAGALYTTRLFRDPSAWYHIVAVWNTTTATASDRMQIWVNGVRETNFTTNTPPSQNQQSFNINNNVIHNIGRKANGATAYFDGYMTEINFIDGQALTPSSFGYTHPKTGVWRPKPYTGTYGTNGFYLKFSDIATTSGSNAGLGKDFSGNANYWNTTNISVTAGATYDAMTDSPTLTSATVGNYAVLNALAPAQSGVTLSNGNLRFTNTSTTSAFAVASTFGATDANSGELPSKFYFEATLTQANTAGSNNSQFVGVGGSVYRRDGTNAGGGAFGATYTTGDVIGVADDVTNSTVYFYKNNVLQGSQTYTAGSTRQPQVYGYSNIIWDINFGQRPFSYTPPTGFKALNTFNLPNVTVPKGNKVMDATLYTGNGSSISVVNSAGFRPDFVWVKRRSNVQFHALYDSIRGVQKVLQSNTTSAEITQTDALSSFNSNGYSFLTNVDGNGSGSTYVGWQWQAGQGTTSSNTSGSITSTVSVNPTAGFSIVTYTGNGVAGATFGHGLGVAPKMIAFKARSLTNNWGVWHTSLGVNGALNFNTTAAVSVQNAYFNGTLPTSTLVTVGTDNSFNSNGATYVAYCWAEIAGFSKFGSYTGNGSTDGTFVYTGFRPKFLMTKRTDTTGNWIIVDTSRTPSNVANLSLDANTSDADKTGSGATTPFVDILSNGFKQRTTGTGTNASGGTYIYMAFAENPTKYALAR